MKVAADDAGRAQIHSTNAHYSTPIASFAQSRARLEVAGHSGQTPIDVTQPIRSAKGLTLSHPATEKTTLA